MRNIFQRFSNPIILIACFSALIALVGFVKILSSLISYSATSSYAVLSIPESYDSQSVEKVLRSSGFIGLISEESQWVDIAAFNSLERVPLDNYSERLDKDDPRNDGYAERLKLFFHSDGYRHIYLPMKGTAAALKKSLRKALPDIAYQLRLPGRVEWLCVIFFLISVIITFFSFGDTRPTLPALPALLGLSGLGVGGLAVAIGLFLGIVIIKDLVISLASRMSTAYTWKALRRIIVSTFHDESSSALALGFIAMGMAGAVIGDVPVFITLAGAASAIAATFLVPAIIAVKNMKRSRLRFVPVKILREDIDRSRFFLRLGPVFAIVVLAAFVVQNGFTKTRTNSANSIIYNDAEVTIEEYEKHITYQKSFALSRLRSLAHLPYGGFVIDTDGLLLPGEKFEIEDEPIELPPVERFLVNSSTKFLNKNGVTVKIIAAIIGVLMLLVSIAAFTSARRRYSPILIRREAAA